MKDFRVIEGVEDLRSFLALRGDGTVGFVPTMGSLHAGHEALMRQAARECGLVVVSVFINPLQFGPSEDFAAYPRSLSEDCRIAESAGAQVVFAPGAQEMIGKEPLTTVSVSGIGDVLCGRSRPGHFTGVATIVAVLFNIVRPDRAYFGEKDRQQLLVVGKMVRDLNFGVEIVGVPTVRDTDGLAISSRNTYLDESERVLAPAFPRALEAARRAIAGGERDAGRVRQDFEAAIAAAVGIELEYFSVCKADTLADIDRISGDVVLAAAVRIGATRLIDNLEIHV